MAVRRALISSRQETDALAKEMVTRDGGKGGGRGAFKALFKSDLHLSIQES